MLAALLEENPVFLFFFFIEKTKAGRRMVFFQNVIFFCVCRHIMIMYTRAISVVKQLTSFAMLRSFCSRMKCI
jgi:hypothetical protein